MKMLQCRNVVEYGGSPVRGQYPLLLRVLSQQRLLL